MHSPLICMCYNIRKSALLLAIRKKGLKTMEEVKNATNAGTACGCCIDDIVDILNEELKAENKQ